MGNAPKQPKKHLSQRADLRRWDDEGGAPRFGHPSHEPHLAPKQQAEPALYYFNIRTERGFIEDQEGEKFPNLQTARAAALVKARNSIAEGDHKGEDRRSWRFEIMDRANEPVLTVAFLEALDTGTSE